MRRNHLWKNGVCVWCGTERRAVRDRQSLFKVLRIHKETGGRSVVDSLFVVAMMTGYYGWTSRRTAAAIDSLRRGETVETKYCTYKRVEPGVKGAAI